MMMEVDLIPLSQLPSRYGIARSNLYNRLKDLIQSQVTLLFCIIRDTLQLIIRQIEITS